MAAPAEQRPLSEPPAQGFHHIDTEMRPSFRPIRSKVLG